MGKDTEVNESGMAETSAKIPEETANDMGKKTESKESGVTDSSAKIPEEITTGERHSRVFASNPIEGGVKSSRGCPKEG